MLSPYPPDWAYSALHGIIHHLAVPFITVEDEKPLVYRLARKSAADFGLLAFPSLTHQIHSVTVHVNYRQCIYHQVKELCSARYGNER